MSESFIVLIVENLLGLVVVSLNQTLLVVIILLSVVESVVTLVTSRSTNVLIILAFLKRAEKCLSK